MPKRRAWENELAIWIAMKADHPAMSAREFFRVRGINEALGARKIGKKMRGMWEAVRERAIAKMEAKGVINLQKVIEKTLKAHQTQFELGRQALLIRDPEGKIKYEAGDFGEAMRLLTGGSIGITEAVKVLTGGDAIVTVEPRRYRMEWVNPESYRPNPKKPKKKTKKQ